MRWYEVERTEAGRKVFSRRFKYSRTDGKLVVFTDCGLVWFKSSKEGARKFFVVKKPCNDEISASIEDQYKRSLAES